MGSRRETFTGDLARRLQCFLLINAKASLVHVTTADVPVRLSDDLLQPQLSIKLSSKCWRQGGSLQIWGQTPRASCISSCVNADSLPFMVSAFCFSDCMEAIRKQLKPHLTILTLLFSLSGSIWYHTLKILDSVSELLHCHVLCSGLH